MDSHKEGKEQLVLLKQGPARGPGLMRKRRGDCMLWGRQGEAGARAFGPIVALHQSTGPLPSKRFCANANVRPHLHTAS